MNGLLREFSFRGRSEGPHLLIIGGVHGDEFEPIAAIRRLVRLFDPPSSLQNQLTGTVTFIPIVNEAAFLRGQRCAEDDKDLARTCPGAPDGSVTERTAWALSERIRQSDGLIDLHTGGTALSIFPLAGYMMHSDVPILDLQRRMARAFNLPLIWGTAANLNGRSLSVARDAGIPAIYCEHGGSACCSEQGVQDYVDGCLNVMSELGMLPGSTRLDRVRYVVENPQPDSGHLQICNPAPVAGCWTSLLKPGDLVRSGQELGTIDHLDGSGLVTIPARESGLLVVTRTFPRVVPGDSLAVIVELP